MIDDIKQIIIGQLGTEESKVVLDAIDAIQLQSTSVVPNMEGKTYGAWNVSLPFNVEDTRSLEALSYVIIKEMLKSGAVRFALEMKRAQMFSEFKNGRSIKIHTVDKNLKDITEIVLDKILPQLVWELTFHSLVYGTAIAEQVWENTTKEQFGLEGEGIITVPKVPNFVPIESVRHINRTANGSFDGFTQAGSYIKAINQKQFNEDIRVQAKDSLVVPYNGYSRNLWGESFFTVLYPIWFSYELVLRACVQYSQLMGDPPRLGKAPSRKKVRLSGSTSMVDAMDYLLAISASLPKTNSVIIPSDVDPENGKPEWELGYLTMPERSQPFVAILEMFHQLMLRAALTADTSITQGSPGSSTIGEIHATATAKHNEMVISNWLHYINRYFIPNIALYNSGENPPALWLELKGLDPKEREFFNAIMGIAGNSKTFEEFFYTVDWQSLANLAGLPVLDKEDADKLKAELQQQGLDNQEAQMQMAKKYETPNATQDPNKLKKQAEQKEVAQKLEALADSGLMAVSEHDIPFTLANPFHDKLGRFASKASAGISVIGSETKKRAGQAADFAVDHKKEIGIVAKDAAQNAVLRPYGLPRSKIKPKQTADKIFMSDADYKIKYDSLPSYAKALVTNPAEALTRKGKKGAVARFGMDLGSTIATRMMARYLIYGSAYALGGVATATALSAMFGSAPLWAVTVGGMVIGSATTAAVSGMLDFGVEELLNTYIDKHSPKDSQHIMMGGMHGVKRKGKMMGGIAGTEALVAVAAPIPMALGAIGGLGIEALQFYGDYKIGLEDSESYSDNITARCFSAMIMPMIVDNLLFEDADPLVVPVYDYRLGAFGFDRVGSENFMVLNQQGALRFVENYATGNFPDLVGLGWGSIDIQIDETAELEAIELGNPFHDSLGRFAPKDASKFFGGNSASAKADSKATKKAKTIVGSMGKQIGGTVDGLDVSVCGTWECVKKKSGSGDKDMMGVFSSKNNTLTLTPSIKEWGDYGFERITKHETIHARKRSKGKDIGPLTIDKSELEEGLTELIYHSKTGDKQVKASPYIRNMQAVAKAAKQGSGGDRKKALALVDEWHYKNDTNDGLKGYSKAMGGGIFNANFLKLSLGTGTNEDINWLLGGGVALEEEIDYTAFGDAFIKSEIAVRNNIHMPTGNSELREK